MEVAEEQIVLVDRCQGGTYVEYSGGVMRMCGRLRGSVMCIRSAF